MATATETETETETETCYCPICGSGFSKPHGVKVHYFRIHKKTTGPWRDEWEDTLNQPPGSSQTGVVTKVTQMVGAIKELLVSAPNRCMTTAQLMEQLRANGMTQYNDDALRTSISTAVRLDQSGEINRPERGFYQLVKKNRRGTKRAQPQVTSSEQLPSFDEVASALRTSEDANRKKMAVIEALLRVVMVALD